MTTSDTSLGLVTDLISMIMTDVSRDPAHQIEPETDLLLTGLVDSLGVVMIVGWLEDTLDIEIDPADVILSNFQTVQNMLDYVERRAAGQPGGGQ